MIPRLEFLSLVLTSIALAGCASSLHVPQSRVGAAETIAISRGPCFGFCPVYTLRLAADATLVFDGARHTAALGERRKTIDQATYRAVAADLARFRPKDMGTRDVACQIVVSDQASYEVTWSDASGGQRTIRYAGGCREGEGAALEALLRALPERLGIADWAGQKTYPGATRG